MGGPLKAFRFASSQPGPRPNALGKRWVPAVDSLLDFQEGACFLLQGALETATHVVISA